MKKFIEITSFSNEIPAVKYFAQMIEKFEKGETALEEAKVEIGLMRQHNRASHELLTAMTRGL